MRRVLAALGLGMMLSACAMTEPPAVSAAPLQVYAAGSLREAFTAIAADYEARTGQKIALNFGASGLLRGRIEQGEGAQVFASADTEHPQRLAARGLAGAAGLHAQQPVRAHRGADRDHAVHAAGHPVARRRARRHFHAPGRSCG